MNFESVFRNKQMLIKLFVWYVIGKQIQQMNQIFQKGKGDRNRDLFLVEKNSTDNKTDTEVNNEEEKPHGINLDIEEEENKDE